MKLFKMMTVAVATLALLAGCDDEPATGTPTTDTTADSSNDTGGGDTAGTDTGGTDTGGTDIPVTDTGGPDAAADTGGTDTGGTDTGGTDIPVTDTGGTDTATGDVAACMPTYADEISRINYAQLPENSAEFNCDSNLDETIDDADGELNGLLSQLTTFVDANGELATAIEDGDLILLAEMVGYAGADGTGITTNLLIGSDVDTQPDPTCGVGAANLDDVCDWNVDPDSYDETCTSVVTIPECTVTSGALACGPQDFQFQLPLGGLNLDLNIQDGQVLGTVGTGATLAQDGRLCGSVEKSNITDAIDAACAAPDAPSFCDFAGAIGLILNCGSDDMCTIVLSLAGVGTGTVQLGE